MENLISMIQAQIKRQGTKTLLATGAILILLAILIGIADNPPGIILTYGGVFFVFLAFVHHWREAGVYGTLLAVAVVSFPVLILLHNIFDTLVDKTGGIPVLDQLLFGFSVIFFLGAVFVAPVGIVIGVILGLYYLIRSNFKG